MVGILVWLWSNNCKWGMTSLLKCHVKSQWQVPIATHTEVVSIVLPYSLFICHEYLLHDWIWLCGLVEQFSDDLRPHGSMVQWQDKHGNVDRCCNVRTECGNVDRWYIFTTECGNVDWLCIGTMKYVTLDGWYCCSLPTHPYPNPWTVRRNNLVLR